MLGPKHAAPSVICRTAEDGLGFDVVCGQGETEITALTVEVGTFPPCVLSVIVRLGAIEASFDNLSRWCRRLFPVLRLRHCRVMSGRSQGKVRAVRSMLGVRSRKL